MRWAGALATLLAVAALLWGSAAPVQACSCRSRTTADLVARADTILIGTVDDARILVRGVYDPSGYPAVHGRIGATVEVQRYLKGVGPDAVAVEEIASPCELLFPGATGGTYLLILVGERSPFEVEGGICSGSFNMYNPYETEAENLPADVALVQQQALNEIVLITGPGVAPVTNDAPAIPLAVAAVAIPLAFVLAASFVFPAKGTRA